MSSVTRSKARCGEGVGGGGEGWGGGGGGGDGRRRCAPEEKTGASVYRDTIICTIACTAYIFTFSLVSFGVLIYLVNSHWE